MSFDSSTLESMCELIVDCPHSTPEWTESGFIVLRNQNIKNGQLDLSSPSFTNEVDFIHRTKRATPVSGDIVFTREAPMGEVCLIPDNLVCCLGQRQVLLRPKKDTSGEYLFWALQSPFVQHQISWNEGTGSTVSNVRIPVLKALKIPRKSNLNEEIKVAKILSDLAQKITLNRQINQTLEAMAQALFKSWFVDFEPVKAKLSALAVGGSADDANLAAMSAISGKTTEQLLTLKTTHPDQFQQLYTTADLFPSEMVDSELGEIPKGWEVKAFGDEFDVTMGQSPPGESYNEIGEGVAFFQGRTDFGERYPTNRVYTTQPNRMANAGDTLLSVRAPVGDINKAETNCCIGRGLSAIRHKSGCEAYTYYALWNLSAHFDSFDKEGTVFGSINQKDLKALKLVFSSAEVRDAFSKTAMSFDERISINSQQITTLQNLRDSLLPKLLSGELQISTEDAV